jgi:hypothetical protein
MPFAYGEPVTFVTRVRSTNADGNDTWTDGKKVTVPGAYAPAGNGRANSAFGTENTAGRDTLVIQPAVYLKSVQLPANFAVAATDQVIVRGQRFDIQGTPAEWRNPFTGSRPGWEIRLKAMTG